MNKRKPHVQKHVNWNDNQRTSWLSNFTPQVK